MLGKLLWILSVTNALANIETGYYWLDYNGGKMPENCLSIDEEACLDVYAGQVYTKAYELLPAMIRTFRPYAWFDAYAYELFANENIKVLCSQFKGNFRWVHTNVTAYLSIPNIVQGGVELGGKQYFGRIYRNGTAIVGKLGGALTLPLNGRPQFVYDNFEVLVYDKLASCSSGQSPSSCS